MVGRLSKIMSERTMVMVSFAFSSVSCAMWSATMFWSTALWVLLPFSLASGVLNCVVTSMISKRANSGDVGGALGMSASVASLTRIVAPIIGGRLMEDVSFSSPAVFSCVVSAVGLSLCAFIPMEEAECLPPPRDVEEKE